MQGQPAYSHPVQRYVPVGEFTTLPGAAIGQAPGARAGTPQTPQTPKTPDPITQQPTPTTETPDLTGEQASPGGSESVALATPNVIGDFVSLRVLRTPTGATALQAYNQALGVVTAVRSGVFKIADNENVQPTTRVFFNYNYFYNVNSGLRPEGIPRADVHRQIAGFEYANDERSASFGMRVPLMQKQGDGGLDFLDGFDDLAFVGKYAFINRPQDGTIASVGLVATAPTGRDIIVPGQSNINPVVVAPWVGALVRGESAYVQAFSQIAVPFDGRDATLWFNDIAVGYTVLNRTDSDSFLTQVTPVFEAHINTPLSHRGSFATVIGVPDWIVLTAGSHFTFNQRATVTLAVGTPITGPRLYDVEAIAQFNFRF